MGIDYFSYGHPLTRVRSYFSERARIEMYRIFVDTMRPAVDSKLLDLGVTADQKLPESNYFEELYPYKKNIVSASIEDAAFLTKKYDGLKFVRIQKGRSLPFRKDTFDIVFCSAVLEHVGKRSMQKKFILEALRVSKRFFFTTPNRFFPIEMHTMMPFIHWLPKRIFQRLLSLLGFRFLAKTENLNLLSSKALLSLFPNNAEKKLIQKHLFGLTSNLIVHGSRKRS